LKRVWMPSLLSASALFLLGQDRVSSTRHDSPSERNFEWKLAGVLPGHTTFRRAKAIMGEGFSDISDYKATWTTCEKELLIQADHKGIVKVVRVARISDKRAGIDCFGSASGESTWVTGRGLGLDDSTERITQLYGQADSQKPSMKGGQQLELLHYTFDRAGRDVPQVMEVLCTLAKNREPGRVVEIKLVTPNL
jgi:hypothetical protein